MLICRDCGNVFFEGDCETVCENRGEFWGSPAFERISVCPACGSDDISDAVKCDICGEYIPAEEAISGEDGEHFCEVCVNEVGKKVEKLIADKLSDAEKHAWWIYREWWGNDIY